MKATHARYGQRFAIAIATCLFSVLTAIASAQSDAHVGTWELNLAKSTFDPGPPPRRQTLFYKEEGKGLTALLQGIDAAGKPITLDTSNLVINFDGKDHPTARVNYDTSAWTRISPNKYHGVPQEVRKSRPNLRQRSLLRRQDDDHYYEGRGRKRATDQQRQGLRQAILTFPETNRPPAANLHGCRLSNSSPHAVILRQWESHSWVEPAPTIVATALAFSY